MPSAEDKTTRMTPEDHTNKLADWIRHECKKSHPLLNETIAAGLKGGSDKLVKLLNEKCGIEHDDLKLAIDNTIKAIG